MRAESKKSLFHHWQTRSDKFFNTGPESPPAKMQAAFRAVAEAATYSIKDPESYLMALTQLGAEREWHALGRPYFKVHSQAAHWLMNTAMTFSAEHFAAPFEIFTVMLPAEFGPVGTMFVAVSDKLPLAEEQETFFEKHRDLADPFGRGVCRQVADYVKGEREELERLVREYGAAKLQFCFSWIDSDGGVAHAHMVVYERMTLEDALMYLDRQDGTMGDILNPALSWKHRMPMIRLGVGVAMFAANKHELVAPDVNIEQLRSRFPGGRSRGSQLLAQQSIAKELKKCRGWAIGHEIELPRPEYIRRDCEHSEGSELEFSHVRSGHMRMQPHGPANSLRKLIFIPPTVVRKDLPIQPHRGFRLRDNIVPESAGVTA